MRFQSALLVVLAPLALAACHSHGGYFESDPVLALGPGCPDCPSRSRWPAYFGTGGEAPRAEEMRAVAVVEQRPVVVRPSTIAATYRPVAAPVVVTAPPRPTLVATSRPVGVRSSGVEAPRLDVDFGLAGPGGQVVVRPAPDAEQPVAPPRPGAPLPPPTPASPFRYSDMPGGGVR